MLNVKINGKVYEAKKGEFLLELCRRNHILIPTLCHHESLSGQGACRLCVAEINEGNKKPSDQSGRKVVVSCVYPLSRDCEVFTESEKIKKIRKKILSMLITKAPAADRLASLCQIYGVETAAALSKSPSKAEERLKDACVICGLCVRACTSLGTGAISTVGRGVVKKISTPYGEPSADCIGCGSCALACPTKAIELTENKGKRYIWGREFKLLSCASCRNKFATEEEYALALDKAETRTKAAPLCSDCRRKKSTDVFAAAFGARQG